MIPCYKLRTVLALLASFFLVATVAPARNRKGDKLLKLGQKAEALKEYDQAVTYYEQAVHEDPQDPGYLLAARRARFQASQLHVDRGLKLKKAGELEQAL